MESVSLRDHIDQRIHDLSRHVDQRFDDLHEEVVASRTHKHAGYVSWVALVPILGSLVWMLS